MNEEIYKKSKDDFDLFAELDAAYREDFLGERKDCDTGEILLLLNLHLKRF